MPNNVSVDTLNTQIERLGQRMTVMENRPQIGNSAIQQGGLQILDGNGNIVAIFGYQPDGSIGLATYNPGGTKVIQVGNQPDGSKGLALYTTVGAKVVGLGYQSDGSVGLATFNGGLPVVTLGEDPSNIPGLNIYDPSGNRQVQLGEISASPLIYGLAVLDPTHSIMQRMSGISASVANSTQFTTSTSYVTFSDDPSVTVTIGPSGQAEISYGCHIGTGGDNDEGRAALTTDGAMTNANEYVDMSCAGVGVGVAGSVSKTSVIAGLSPGTHTFSLECLSLTGVHGSYFRQRFVAVNPL